MKTNNRLDWTITHRNSWTATHKSGEILVAISKVELMKKINLFYK